MGEAQENVFTALGDRVMRSMCKLNVEGATPGTHLTHDRYSCGKRANVFGAGPLYGKMPTQANTNAQTKQQQQQIPQSLRLRHRFLSFLYKRLGNTKLRRRSGERKCHSLKERLSPFCLMRIPRGDYRVTVLMKSRHFKNDFIPNEK